LPVPFVTSPAMSSYSAGAAQSWRNPCPLTMTGMTARATPSRRWTRSLRCSRPRTGGASSSPIPPMDGVASGGILGGGCVAVLERPILDAIRQVTGRPYQSIDAFNDDLATTHALALKVLHMARQNLCTATLASAPRYASAPARCERATPLQLTLFHPAQRRRSVTSASLWRACLADACPAHRVVTWPEGGDVGGAFRERRGRSAPLL
jgi:hypothetical protein